MKRVSQNFATTIELDAGWNISIGQKLFGRQRRRLRFLELSRPEKPYIDKLFQDKTLAL